MMKYVYYIVYGLIVANFIMKVVGKVSCKENYPPPPKLPEFNFDDFSAISRKPIISSSTKGTPIYDIKTIPTRKLGKDDIKLYRDKYAGYENELPGGELTFTRSRPEYKVTDTVNFDLLS